MKNKSIAYLFSMMMTFVFLVSSAHAAETQSRSTFAVVWTIDTENVELFNGTIGLHATKVLELWRDGVVENVYFDTENRHDVLHKGDPARVMFFIKATSDAEAKKILNELPLVKKKVATYTLFPVGALWLTQF